jgi:hypothetical protein
MPTKCSGTRVETSAELCRVESQAVEHSAGALLLATRTLGLGCQLRPSPGDSHGRA